MNHHECKDCRWSSPDKTFDGEAVLECRRFPPVPVKVGNQYESIWPHVTSSMACGEFAPAHR